MNFKVYNQFTEQFSVQELAEKVKEVSKTDGIDVSIQHVENPRVEAEEHYFNAVNTNLDKFRFKTHIFYQKTY